LRYVSLQLQVRFSLDFSLFHHPPNTLARVVFTVVFQFLNTCRERDGGNDLWRRFHRVALQADGSGTQVSFVEAHLTSFLPQTLKVSVQLVIIVRGSIAVEAFESVLYPVHTGQMSFPILVTVKDFQTSDRVTNKQSVVRPMGFLVSVTFAWIEVHFFALTAREYGSVTWSDLGVVLSGDMTIHPISGNVLVAGGTFLRGDVNVFVPLVLFMEDGVFCVFRETRDDGVG